jgi:hypothetical protein
MAARTDIRRWGLVLSLLIVIALTGPELFASLAIAP